MVMTELDRFTKMMNGLEGNRPVPYTLKDSKSGITIGRGLDLGQHNVADLRRIGVAPELIKRFVDAGFLGKQGQAARDHLKKSGKFILSEQEMIQLNGKLMTSKIADFNRDYENYMGEPSSTLSENQRFALQSAHFNMGENLFKATEENGGGVTDLTKQLRAKDYKAAAYNIGNWHGIKKPNQPRSRRAAEAQLFAGSIGYEDVDALKTRINEGPGGAIAFMSKWEKSGSPAKSTNNASDPEAQGFANPYELPQRKFDITPQKTVPPTPSRYGVDDPEAQGLFGFGETPQTNFGVNSRNISPPRANDYSVEDPEAYLFSNRSETPQTDFNRTIQQPEQLSEFSSGKITRPALKPLDQGRMVTRDQVTPVVLSDPTNLPAVNETPTNILRDGYGNAVRSGTGDFIYTGFDNPLL